MQLSRDQCNFRAKILDAARLGTGGCKTATPVRSLLLAGLANLLNPKRLAISVEALRPQPLLMPKEGPAPGKLFAPQKLLTLIEFESALAVERGSRPHTDCELLGLRLDRVRQHERACCHARQECLRYHPSDSCDRCIRLDVHNCLLATHQ
jgi:hypothetical protein